MSAWHSYPKVFNIGHPSIDGIFDGPVLIEEKIDGSQFSFGLFDGQIRVRSRGKEFPIVARGAAWDPLGEEGHSRSNWTTSMDALKITVSRTCAFFVRTVIHRHRHIPVERPAPKGKRSLAASTASSQWTAPRSV